MGGSRQSKNLLVGEEPPPTSGLLTFLTFESLSRATSPAKVRGNIHLWDSRGQIREILSAHDDRKPSDYIIGQYAFTAVNLFGLV
jgi:hypothetical protein